MGERAMGERRSDLEKKRMRAVRRLVVGHEFFARLNTYVCGTDGAFVDAGCGKDWRARSCMRFACCSLDAGDRASLAMEIHEDPRCIIVDIVPSCQMSVLVLGRHSREEVT